MTASKRFRILAGILIFFAFLVVTAKLVDPDFYWHLRDGETILSTHAVPRVDAYSFTMSGIPWVDHEWLIEGFIAWMWDHNLNAALAAIFAIVAFIPFVIWLRRYRTWPALWAIAAAATLFACFISVRPQVFSYLFFFIVYELLSRYYGDGRDRGTRKKRYLAVLPIVFFLWANIHAEFFSGLVLFGIFLVTDIVVTAWPKKKIDWSGMPFSFGIFLVSAIVPLLNPYGAGLYGEIFRVMFSGNTMRYIQEWKSPFAGQATFSPLTIAIAALVSFFILIVIKYYKRITPTALAAGVIFFALFAKATRMGPLFAIAAVPLIAEGFGYVHADLSPRWHLASRRTKRIFLWLGIAVSIAAFCLITITPATLAATQYPVGATVFLNAEVAQGKNIILLNNYDWGGYLIWNAPEIKIFVDGRMPHWIAPNGTSAMGDYIRLLLSPVDAEGRQIILDKWSINTVLLPSPATDNNAADDGLVNQLTAAGWITGYQDSVAIVLQRPAGQ